MSAVKAFFDGQGARIALGPQLGRGGEGAVYAIAGTSDEVAKIYHAALPPEKQIKLRFMAGTRDPIL